MCSCQLTLVPRSTRPRQLTFITRVSHVPQLASLCTMIDPNLPHADVEWWGEKIEAQAAVADGDADAVPKPEGDGHAWGDNPALARLSQAERDALDGHALDALRAEGMRELEARDVAETEGRRVIAAAQELSAWRGEPHNPRYFLRREKATVGLSLPDKTIGQIAVHVSPAEWAAYAPYEKKFLDAYELWCRMKAGLPQTRAQERKAFIKVVSMMQVCRMKVLRALGLELGHHVPRALADPCSPVPCAPAHAQRGQGWA